MNSDTKNEEVPIGRIVNHVKPFFAKVLRSWPVLAVAALAGAGIGTLYYYKQEPKFRAVCTFILEDKQAGMSGLGSLVTQLGFDFGGLNDGGLFTGDNIFEILRSKKIIRQVLISKVDSTQPNSSSLAELYADFSRLRSKWKSDEALRSVSLNNIDTAITPKQDTAINIIYEKLLRKSLVIDRMNKNGNLIYVQVTAANRQFAIQMAKRIVEEARSLYIHIKVGNALGSIDRLQRKADSLEMLLNGKTFAAAFTEVIDANPGLSMSRARTEIANRDKMVVATLYAEVVKNLEASKMMLAQQTPVIQIIDYPDMTTKDNLVEAPVAIIVGVLAMVFLAVLVIFIRYVAAAPDDPASRHEEA